MLFLMITINDDCSDNDNGDVDHRYGKSSTRRNWRLAADRRHCKYLFRFYCEYLFKLTVSICLNYTVSICLN